MLTAFQVAPSDDQRRGNDFIAGKHRGRHCRLLGHRASKIGITAGFQTGANRSEGETARHLVIAKEGSGGRISHLAFTLSRERS
jgi:hypothetical protein